MKKKLDFFFIAFVVIFIINNQPLLAETFHSELYGFSIDIPDGWSKRRPKKSWTLFTYAQLRSGENLNMNVQNMKGFSSIKQVQLRQTFHPFYDNVIMINKSYEITQGTDVLNCVYKFKESDLKKKIEGKYRLQYYLCQWITAGIFHPRASLVCRIKPSYGTSA